MNIIPIIARGNSFIDSIDKWSEYRLDESRRNTKKLRLYSRERYISDPPKSTRLISGEERLKKFEWILENGFKLKRHLFQREFHNKAIETLAPQIVGEDWNIIAPAIAKQKGWDLKKSSKMLLASAPRRFGKSTAESQIAAAYAIVVPNSIQSIFSTSQRISFYLGEMIYKMIGEYGWDDHVEKFGKERMIIRGDTGDEKDVRIISYYPGNSKVDMTHIFFIYLFHFCLCDFFVSNVGLECRDMHLYYLKICIKSEIPFLFECRKKRFTNKKLLLIEMLMMILMITKIWLR